ncbi:scavenger receptor class F member 2-like isoform X2 [Crassostrea angulata]|uniref:scavenger receptor class F member 2-like isoform X2 n=1 Tax=Magallana angulata TaxID=2784310 RepID=UPI00148A73BF|nr:scavenger receptor class F member 2-like isoform X2 [Crassostrea gigas]XP_052706526.1 scavenger receptor class F member 2-like isoform X2 [Crassostrea angulata]
MRYKLKVILLTLIAKVFTKQMPGICSNGSQGNPIQCCRNYILDGKSCKECSPGTFGYNCTEDCPPQFYGRFCREKCSCCPCDKINGCLKMTTGSLAICFSFGVAIICILRKRKPNTPEGCVVSKTDENDLTASQDMYDCLAKESYNVLTLTTTDIEQL